MMRRVLQALHHTPPPRGVNPAVSLPFYHFHLLSESMEDRPVSGFIPLQSARLNQTLQLVDGLVYVARGLAREIAKLAPPVRSPKRGGTLRPGRQTPLWNALALAVRPHLAKYGEKAKLARLLGVAPQRVHDYFIARRAMPDAERVLLLLAWLAEREAGASPG